ncbi:hypothetical protein FB639_005692, partial [Coemansia asiatica]
STSSSNVRPPAPATLGSGASGIRRLGLSRSRTPAAAAAAAATARPTGSTRSPSLASTGSVSASQAESVEVASDDGFPEDIGPGALMNPPSKKPRDGKLSQILGISSKKRSPGHNRPRLSLSRSKKQRTQDSDAVIGESSMGMGAEQSQDIMGSPMPVVDQDMDFECLLSPQDSSESAGVAQVTTQMMPGSSSLAMQDSLAEQLSEPIFNEAAEPLIKHDDNEKQPDQVITEEKASKTEAPVSVSSKVSVTALDKSKDKDKVKVKGKGKAVDSGPCSARTTLAPSEELVLFESHFGPLDLGLPPIKTSSQRRLMRRTKRC